MNYYPFHIGDYVSATRHLSWDEDAAYRRLLDVYYTTEKPIPLEDRQVFRLVMAQTASQREAVVTVLQEFFEETPDGWVNKRADEVLAGLQEKQEKQRNNVNKRWEKHREQKCSESRNKSKSNSGNTESDAPVIPRYEETDTVVSENCTDLIPPIPIPIPIPITPLSPNGDIPPRGERARASPRSAAPPKPPDVPDQVWTDFLAIRKARRAPLTPTALDGIEREAVKAGIPIAEALTVCVFRGWQSFRADWDWKAGSQPRAGPGPGSNQNRQQALEQRNATVISNWKPPEESKGEQNDE
ncbi:MAG: YdaU family protein [Zoogloeaceae bacterium]|jgi:uncharacterized protein YdaU (DUF1376 family)|nr:YdaU family protein [Zoogloeaceae bacterium]